MEGEEEEGKNASRDREKDCLLEKDGGELERRVTDGRDRSGDGNRQRDNGR